MSAEREACTDAAASRSRPQLSVEVILVWASSAAIGGWLSTRAGPTWLACLALGVGIGIALRIVRETLAAQGWPPAITLTTAALAGWLMLTFGHAQQGLQREPVDPASPLAARLIKAIEELPEEQRGDFARPGPQTLWESAQSRWQQEYRPWLGREFWGVGVPFELGLVVLLSGLVFRVGRNRSSGRSRPAAVVAE